MNDIFMNFEIASLGLIFLVVLSGAVLCGIFLGERMREKPEELRTVMGDVVPSTILGFMSLLVGFTFSMAQSRFELRRQLVVGESNAIGTAYLRTDLLPHTEAVKSRVLLRAYVDNRLRYYELDRDSTELPSLEHEALKIHTQLWNCAMVGATGERTALMSLYAASINAVIDVYAVRLAALRHRVPESVFLTIVVAGFFGLLTLGYSQGMARRIGYLSGFIIAVFITIVLVQIMDIDRQRRGVIRISQESMTDLQRQVNQL
jgi:hypothetical protein